MPGEEQGPIGEQRRDAVVRGDDSLRPGEQLGLTLDQRGIGAEVGDGRGGPDLGRGQVEHPVDLAQRVAAHNDVEGASAERSRLVQPRQPGLGDDQAGPGCC